MLFNDRLKIPLATLLFFFFYITQIVIAISVNRTIDDTYGDPVTGEQVQYLPAHSPDDEADSYWKNVAECAVPNACAIKPPVTYAYNNTYTSTSYFPGTSIGNNISAGFTFNGSAVYIYLILSNTAVNSSLFSNVACDFRLDGELVGSFSHTSDGSGQYLYNVLAYNATSLVNQQHTILLETTGSQSSFNVFDYAVYTIDVEDDPSTNRRAEGSRTNLGAILGGLFGGLVAVAIVGALAVTLRRRRARRGLHLASQISRLDTRQISSPEIIVNENVNNRQKSATFVRPVSTLNTPHISSPGTNVNENLNIQRKLDTSVVSSGSSAVESGGSGINRAPESSVAEEMPPAYSLR